MGDLFNRIYVKTKNENNPKTFVLIRDMNSIWPISLLFFKLFNQSLNLDRNDVKSLCGAEPVNP